WDTYSTGLAYPLNNQTIAGAVPVTSDPTQGSAPNYAFKQSAYSGFDFANVWAINPGINGGYPYLRNIVLVVPTAPTVAAIAATRGAAGISVQIMGTNFTGATAVKFGNANALFTVNSATLITATSPAETPGVVDVTVTVAGVTSATGTSDQFTYVSASSLSN